MTWIPSAKLGVKDEFRSDDVAFYNRPHVISHNHWHLAAFTSIRINRHHVIWAPPPELVKGLVPT